MAIIISYPSAGTVTTSDNLLGTQFDGESGANITKNFSVAKIVDLAVETTTAGGWTGVFNTNAVLSVTVENGIITNVQTIG
jgi:hypothetical protein